MDGGKIIRAHTKVQDSALVHDTILSRAVGYIKQYQPLGRDVLILDCCHGGAA